jgi:hypothetical protein
VLKFKRKFRRLKVKEIGWGMGGMDWIGLAQNRNRWQSLALVDAVMNLWVP